LANSPSNLARSATPLRNFSSAPAETSALSAAGEAPMTLKPKPGNAWNTALIVRPVS